MSLRAGCVERCPGCSHRSHDSATSESLKREWLVRALSPWSERVEPVRAVSGERRWSYREKACLRAEWGGDRWKFGLLVRREPRSREMDLVEIPGCPVHSEWMRGTFEFLSRKLPGPHAMPLAFVVATGRLVTLVVKARSAGDLSWVAGVDWAGLGVEGLFLNLNPSAGDRVFSARAWTKLWGEDRARLAGGFTHGPDSFQQLIPELYLDSLDEAARFLAPGAGDSVLDLCSGIGISLSLWKAMGASALGIELGGESVACAQLNTREGPGEVELLRGRVSDRLPQMEQWLKKGRPHLFQKGGDDLFLAYANPPRLGLESEVCSWLAEKARPSKIAYLSCSAGTLARDLAVLTDAGYAVRRIIPYDFFPQTHHVETLALLELDSAGAVRSADDPRGAARTDG